MKKIIVLSMIVVLSVSICACKGAENDANTPPAIVTIAPQDNAAYNKVCDSHVKKMKKESPKLVKEYNRKAKKIKAKGLSKKQLEKQLEKLYGDTLAKAAKIYVAGVSAMTEVKKNAVNEAGFQEWTRELYEAYSEEAAKISKAYNKSLK